MPSLSLTRFWSDRNHWNRRYFAVRPDRLSAAAGRTAAAASAPSPAAVSAGSEPVSWNNSLWASAYHRAEMRADVARGWNIGSHARGAWYRGKLYLQAIGTMHIQAPALPHRFTFNLHARGVSKLIIMLKQLVRLLILRRPDVLALLLPRCILLKVLLLIVEL